MLSLNAFEMIGPRLARFYSGWTIDYIRGLKLSVINKYLTAMDIMITEECERTLALTTFPYEEEEMRENILNHYCRKIDEKEETQLPPILDYMKDESVSLGLMAAVYGANA